MPDDTEIWKDIQGLEGKYQVSNLGRVKSLARTVRTWNGTKRIQETMLKLRIRNGYLAWKNKNVHRLVAQAFLTKRPDQTLVNHINGNRKDNRSVNLEWCTQSENIRHAWLTGLCNATTRSIMSTKAKIRVGIKNPFFGKKHSEESKLKMSKAKLKGKNPNE